MTFLNKSFWAVISLAICTVSISACAQEESPLIKLQFPMNCALDQDCFIQQFTDMDVSENSLDPFCGPASYDGHKGTDIRLRTLKDLDNNIEVLAAASGTIKGIRKNVPDRLVISDSDRAAIKGIECGNGMVIDHGSNIETQYCHLKQGSPKLNVGDRVEAGDTLGFVGASGLSQFPHLHMTLRQDGKVLDPFTGNLQSQGCDKNTDRSWWAAQSVLTVKRDAVLLGSNLTGGPIKHNTLVLAPPPQPTSKDTATVGWVWYSNLKGNDRVYINLKGPNGFEAENLSKPLNRNKASWSGFVGKKRTPQIGTYKITTYILRNGKKISSNERVIEIKS